MNLLNCFLIFGKQKPPEVHLLSSPEVEFLNARLRRSQSTGIVEIRSAILEQTFGEGTENLFPCWSKPHMVATAMSYEGEHQDEVRRIAACIAEGKPYSLDGGDEWKGSGNAFADLPKPKPIKPGPTGVAKKMPREEKVAVPAGGIPDDDFKLKPRKRKK